MSRASSLLVAPSTPDDSPPTRISSPVRAVLRLIGFLVWTAAAIPAQLLFLGLKLPARKTFPVFFHRNLCRILGFKIVVCGKVTPEAPALIVSNHVSYFDIPIFGAVVEGCFVSKAEVATWPVFGLLAKLQRTVFVDRRRSATANHKTDIQTRLEDGDRLILFPEGTSFDGTRVLPFKSALLSVAAARDGGLKVQPVTIAYTRLDDVPLGRGMRPFYAWYGDMEMASHAWEALGLGKTTVELTFHKPVTLREFGSRKDLARHCQEVIANGLAASNTGRPIVVAEDATT